MTDELGTCTDSKRFPHTLTKYCLGWTPLAQEMSMTNNDREASVAKKALGLSDFGIGVLPEPTFTPKPNRVEIWRYNEYTLAVACSNGNAWNEIDSFVRWQHEGFWDSSHMVFMPTVPSNHFSDGTPVDLYEGLEPSENNVTTPY